MQHSASAPEKVLADSDYYVPSNGVALTGHPNRTLQGPFSKDKGIHSSRINQIVKQATKVPGPNKYLGHTGWEGETAPHLLHGGNKFVKTERTYKSMHKVPAPSHYERKDINMQFSLASKDCLSQNPRILQGFISKAKKRSFLDQADRHSKEVPGPGHATPKPVASDRMDGHVKHIFNWKSQSVKTKGKGQPEKEIGPNHYHLNHSQTEERPLEYSAPKDTGNNFIDKGVKETKWVPGAGTYATHTFDDSKLTRGTRHLQLRGLARSSVSGYF